MQPDYGVSSVCPESKYLPLLTVLVRSQQVFDFLRPRALTAVEKPICSLGPRAKALLGLKNHGLLDIQYVGKASSTLGRCIRGPYGVCGPVGTACK